jgi:hypothetical protein
MHNIIYLLYMFIVKLEIKTCWRIFYIIILVGNIVVDIYFNILEAVNLDANGKKYLLTCEISPFPPKITEILRLLWRTYYIYYLYSKSVLYIIKVCNVFLFCFFYYLNYSNIYVPT